VDYKTISEFTNAAKGGTIHTLTYTKELKTLKNVTDVITKTTKCQVQLNCRYDNLKAVKEARADGSLPAENQGLPKGTSWVEGSKALIRTDSTGKISLRCTKFNGNKGETTYYRNGQVVNKEEIKPLCYSSEFPVYKEDKVTPIFNIGIEKIDSII